MIYMYSGYSYVPINVLELLLGRSSLIYSSDLLSGFVRSEQVG